MHHVKAYSAASATSPLAPPHSGSNIGGVAETQEMLEFCGAHGITADVEVIPIQEVNEAYERLVAPDVR